MMAIDYLRIINRTYPQVRYLFRNKIDWSIGFSEIKPKVLLKEGIYIGSFNPKGKYKKHPFTYHKPIEFGTTNWLDSVICIDNEHLYPKSFILQKVDRKSKEELTIIYPNILEATEEERIENDLDYTFWQNSPNYGSNKKELEFHNIIYKAISITDDPYRKDIIKNISWVYGDYKLNIRKGFGHFIMERSDNVYYDIERRSLYKYDPIKKHWIKQY